METFRAVTHVAAVRGWELHQVDIVTAFLRGKLEPGEEVYMKQPKGFEVEGKEDQIWELLKGLYGLPQGSRVWNKTMNAGMADLGFTRISCEYCLYFRETESGSVLTGIHVDDFLMAVSSLLEASNFKAKLSSIWEIKDLGEAKFCVGVAIERDLINRHVYLSQTALIDKILEQFNMTDCNPVSTPMESGLILSRYSDITPSPEQELKLLNLPYRRLVGNNKKVIGFLKAYVEDGEKTFLATDNAHTAWTKLIDRHEKQGPITQVRLTFEGIKHGHHK
jgi:hypothetical protein